MREPGKETDRGAERAPAAPARRDPVEEASEESFPASDPPAAQPLHVGRPDEHPDTGARER
jgi:hypothetical protein